MIIRQERPEDFAEIYAMVQTAFETAPYSDGDEQDFVNYLRASGEYIPELALVAEERGAIVGHIMLTRTFLRKECETNASGCKEETLVQGVPPILLLAPLAVRLENRCCGVGGSLVDAAMQQGLSMGFKAVFLVGEPQYYGQFGFVPASYFGIRSALDIPEGMEDCVMAHELEAGALAGFSGIVSLGDGWVMKK